MTIVKFAWEHFTHDFTLQVDGKDYRIIHAIDTRPKTKWSAAGRTERWIVQSRVGIHAAAHNCDPEKPTYKKIVKIAQRVCGVPASDFVPIGA